VRERQLGILQHERDLQGLLGSLLSVEPDDIVVDLRVVGELPADLEVAFARRRSTLAHSTCSGFGEDTSLTKRAVHHRAPYLRPPLSECGVHDDQVDRGIEVSESTAEPDGLGEAILDLVLDDQEVEVAALVGVATGTRAKQDHLGVRRRRVDQGTAGALDHLLGTGGNAFDALPEAWRAQMLAHAPATLRKMDQMIRPYPTRAAIRSIACPVTVIEGDLSDPAFAIAVGFVMRLLPQAQLVSLPGAEHMLHVDQPEGLVEIATQTTGHAPSPAPAIVV
jgi:hypothetical protein